MFLTGLGLLLVFSALGLTFVPSSDGGLSGLIMALGGVGAIILCGGGELIQIYWIKNDKKLSQRAIGHVDRVRVGRGIFNGQLLVSLVVSFPAEDGLTHRKKAQALVPLTKLANYGQGCSLVVFYDPSAPDRDIRVELIH